MDRALRELNGEIDLATQRLLDDARTLTDPDLQVPSLLPGWTRGYVLAHLARGADLMRNLLASVRTGQYGVASGDLADAAAATERAAGLRAADLAAGLADAAMSLRAVIQRLPDDNWHVPLTVPGLAPFPAREVLTRRLTEVELHHCDLATGYGPPSWSASFTDMELPEPLSTQRRDRLERGFVAAGPRQAPRPIPAYQPGQRLPGSWIGSGARKPE
jgi:maleylpyruvate isomerase